MSEDQSINHTTTATHFPHGFETTGHSFQGDSMRPEASEEQFAVFEEVTDEHKPEAITADGKAQQDVAPQEIPVAQEPPPREYAPEVSPPEAERTFSLRIMNALEEPEHDGPSSPSAIIQRIHRIERNDGRLSPESLGHMAGGGVLAQYRVAKAETTSHWWKSITSMFTEGHGLLTYAMPIAALGAGVAIDVAIFGGAADDLMHVNPWFKSLAVGSLVFAAGIGLSKNKGFKTFMTGLLVTASFGASMLAADNKEFKTTFANMLPNSLREQSYVAGQDAAIAQAQVKAATDKITRDRYTLDHGGIGGQPIFGDGYEGNDAQGHQLQDVIIPQDELSLNDAMAAAARSSANSNKANEESPALWWGQILGGLYLGAWLIASQMVIAKVIDSASSNLKAGRKETAQHRIKELFVRDLESSRGEAAARIAVSDMLHRFHDAMTDACRKNPIAQEVKIRLAELNSLFSGEDLEKAIVAGVKRVKDTIHPRRETFEDDDHNQSGLMGRAARFKRGSSNNAPSP